MIVVFLAILGLNSCAAPEMEEANIHEMLFNQKRGLISGVEPGDSWEDMKKNHHPDWVIREDHSDGMNIYQYRKDWDEGYNYMYLSVSLDENDKINQMNFSMSATTGNLLQLKKLEMKFISDFSLISLTEKTNDWTYFAENGDEYNVSLTTINIEEDHKILTVNVLKSN